MKAFEFQTVRDIHCASGSAAQLGKHLAQRFSARRVLLITDAGIVRLGLLENTLHSLHSHGFHTHVFSDVIADPPEAVVEAALAQGRAHKSDIVLGFGGGSAMDSAKVIAVLLGTSQPLKTLYGVNQVQGARSIPLVLVPTTAGTGSEVTPIAILTTGESQKMGIVAPQLYADFALLDADLTHNLPAIVTAHTGIDAMVHAIEAYTAQHKKNPLSDMLAREALRLLGQNLLTAIHTPDNQSARTNMMLGAMLAGQAFANAPVGGVHALAYPLGSIYHLSHGLTNALMLLPVLRFNLPQAQALYAELAPLLAPNATGHAEDSLHALEYLCSQAIGRMRLSDYGITWEALPELAQMAMSQTRLLQNNPRPIGVEDALALYQQAW
jgi:alcohol dehydrogenase class IV